MKRWARIAAYVAFAALPVAAQADGTAKVAGWKKSIGAAVETFSELGIPAGTIRPAEVNPAGPRRWKTDSNLIQLPGGQWVQSSDLDLVFCKDPAIVADSGQATRGAGMAAPMGSGNPCRQ